MAYDEFEKIVTTLESMMSDGIGLVHGGIFFDWNDTIIPSLIQHIKEQQQDIQDYPLQTGDMLVNTLTGENMLVTEIDEDTVHLQPQNLPLTYPKKELWVCFQPKEKRD